VSALSARDGHHGQALHHKCAAIVLTLGTLNGQGSVGVGHLRTGALVDRRRSGS
jgi:hypothetical protein